MMPRSASQIQELQSIFDSLNHGLSSLSFAEPVTHVYNPLVYAAESSRLYAERYLCGPLGRTLLLGMNPGPWGMAQTGVPFGEVTAVRDWLQISAPVQKPESSHPKRPITGFECERSEVSGRRLWGFFQEKFGSAEKFARKFVVFNYCPLVFMEESGRNRTPDKLSKTERDALFALCDDCLVSILRLLGIEKAFGVGLFAQKRLKSVASRAALLKTIDSIIHPSPASPVANRGWAEQVAPKLGL